MDPDVERIPPPQLTVIDTVAVTARQLVKRLDREVGVLGLTWAQTRTLLEIADNHGLIHAGEIGRRVGVSRQAAHRSMAELDRRGYLVWQDDGHWKSARLNGAGNEAAYAASAAATGSFDAVWRVPAHELHDLIRAARALRREFRRREPAAAWWLE